MSRLTRDGTAEPVSRDQNLRHARGQGNVHFPCSADHEQDWQPYPVDPYSAICDDHTYIHTYTFISSQAHLLMLESTMYLLTSATWTDDLTPLLSTTGYCWKAVEMSPQQVGIPSTKRNTSLSLVSEPIQARRNASLGGGSDSLT